MRKSFISEVGMDNRYIMSSDVGTQNFLKKAKEKEEKYEWLEAAKIYGKALRSESEAACSIAKTWERIGFCYSLASYQTENGEEFKKLRQSAVEAYKSAAKLFEKEDVPKNHAKSAQCNAIAAYLDSWLAASPSEKRKMLDECRVFGKTSLEAYEKVGDKLGYGKMCNDLLLCLLERLYVASDWTEMRNVAQEGIECINKAISVLSKLGDKNELLRIYFTASLQTWYAANISEQEEYRKELAQRSLNYSEKALNLSREAGNPYYSAMSNWAAALSTLLFTEKVDASLEYAKEMLKQGSIVRDNYLRGVASYVLAFVTNWMTLREADPDKQKEGHEKIFKYAEDAIRYLQLVSEDFYIAETYLYYVESYSSLARDVEASSEERRATLKKAIENGRKGLEHASRSGSLDAMISTLHALSKALHFYSNFVTGKEEKTRLLEEALAHRQRLNKTAEKLVPTNDWILGVGKTYEGPIKAELAKMETDKNRKRVLLESAVSDMEDGVSRCRKSILSSPVPTRVVAVARYEDEFGEILNELYLLTEDKKTLNKAIDVYKEAAEKFKKVNLPSRVAESYWKMARNQDRLGKYQKAAENFENAFAQYKTAAQGIPHFADFYLDYATYMKAWSEIERAKSAHDCEEYSAAMKHYEKIASLLKPSKLWSYLSSDFVAWSILERAEDLSRKESSIESIEAFKKAAAVFKEAKETFEQEIDKIQNLDEKDKAIELSKAFIQRKSYCLARINVEEARINDRKGDYAESAEEYDSAADIFEKMLEAMETEVDREEMKATAYMCRAWEKMKMADARDSAELYHEASELFLKAKEHSTRDKAILMASGNCAFCRALEHGTKFEVGKEKDDFSKAKQYLETASNYYLKAGFDSASLWTNAAGIFFDAYNYVVSAEIDVDPEKKMKAYLLAEKCLERSAGIYETAGYVGKRDEVLKTLSKVKEKREFALSLGDFLTVPSAASSTSMMSAPRLTIEEPVGLLKFERAFVQANLIAHQREVVVGEDFDLEIQLANLGRNTAFLIKLEEAIPEGFDLVEKPEKCLVEDSSLSLKGKKLAPLETGEMKLKLKPRKKGKHVFRPKIHYMDEAGERKSCELEQVTVAVKELGIRGWLKGPG
jgi:tetratricopeptide (TPR) repeat protein